MDDRLKQRLVGAAVIVALAAIFIPMILEGPGDKLGPVGSNMPAAPDATVPDRVEPLILPSPPEPETQTADGVVMNDDTAAGTASEPPPPPPSMPADGAASGSDQAAAPPAAPAAAAPSKNEAATAPPPQSAPALQPDASLTGWVVQVGSFSQEGNALALRDKLRAKGYTAFVEQAKTGGGVTYRVKVGPELNRDNAEKQQTDIENTFKLKGIVTHYP